MQSISLRAVLAAVLYGAMAHAGQAQTFYQCMSAQGQPEFSEQPCLGSKAPGVESLDCQKARKDLDTAVHLDRSTSSDLQARRAAMSGACGLKKPHVTIIGTPATPRPNAPPASSHRPQ